MKKDVSVLIFSSICRANAAFLPGRSNEVHVIDFEKQQKNEAAFAQVEAVSLEIWHIVVLCIVSILIGLIVGAVIKLVASRKAEPEETSEAEPTLPPKPPLDFDRMVRETMEKASKAIGPKFEKGSQGREILEKRASAFQGKAKCFVMTELNTVASDIMKAVETEEATMLLDWNKAVAANFPSPSILLAGLVAPIFLTVSSVIHWMEILLMLIPVLILNVWALYFDWNNTVCSIPTLRLWMWCQSALCLVMLVVHFIQVLRIRSGKRHLSDKAAEMHKRLKGLDGKKQEELGIADMRELFIAHSVMQNRAMLIEDGIRRSIFHHLCGLGSLIWLFFSLWCAILVFGWTFVPGTIAFHESAAEVAHGEYCSSWATVFVARLSTVIGILFLIINLIIVVEWILSVFVGSSMVANALLKKAQRFDRDLMGVPLAQTLCKAFLLRGHGDTRTAQYTVKLYEQSQLEKDKQDIEGELARATNMLNEITRQAEEIKPKEDAGDLHAAIKKLEDAAALDQQDWKARGSALISEADLKAKAEAIESATTKELDDVIKKITDFIEMIQNSEAVADAKKGALEAAEKAKVAAEQAQQIALKKAQEAKDYANSEEVQAMVAKTKEHVQTGMDQAHAAGKQGLEVAKTKAKEAQDFANSEECQKMVADAKAQGKQALDKAHAGAQQGLEVAKTKAKEAQDYANSEECQAAIANAKEQAQQGIDQAKQQGQKGLEATSKKAKEIADSEEVKTAVAEAQKSASQASAAASTAAASAKASVKKSLSGKMK